MDHQLGETIASHAGKTGSGLERVAGKASRRLWLRFQFFPTLSGIPFQPCNEAKNARWNLLLLLLYCHRMCRRKVMEDPAVFDT